MTCDIFCPQLDFQANPRSPLKDIMASQNSCNSAYLAVPQDELSQPLKPYLIKKIYDEVDEDLPVTSFSSRLRQRIFQNRMHWATHFLLSLMLMLSIITPAFPGFAKENNRGHLIRPAEGFATFLQTSE
jgi:hypothetical protein